MSHFFAAPSAPPTAAPRLVRWLWTSNPFYAISAALFLGGLRLSFGTQGDDIETWSLMSGLAGYTLLLAVTAWLLIRFGQVWDDARTVLLLVVLMFLATSVTFDEVLVLNPTLGTACCLIGLGLAVAVSEGLLWGTGLRLPACFRVPYHLLLALFFLYPLALSPMVARPHAEELLWGLYGFSVAGGLAFLTLLPAARRGRRSVRVTGSPWSWPLYPWVLLGLLGAAVPARAFLLCWSMHLLEAGSFNQLVFGPHFLVPFGLAVAFVLLEAGLASGHRRVLGLALALPGALALLAMTGHRSDAIYQEFLGVFTARLGGSPAYLTLTAAVAFYLYAALRRVPSSFGVLTAALLGLAVISPATFDLTGLTAPRPLPILTAAVLQLGLGLRRRESFRCLFGGCTLAVAAALTVPEGAPSSILQLALVYHLALLTVLLVGAVFDDDLARLLRVIGPALILLACLGALFGPSNRPQEVPAWEARIYLLLMTALLAGYGLLLRQRPALALAGLTLVCWLGVEGWHGYAWMRQAVAGLDYLLLSLAVFAVAVLISLAKTGLRPRWLTALKETPPTLDG